MIIATSEQVSTELRLGVVGFGIVARDYYLPALGRLTGVRVVSVADPLPESRRAATERLEDAAVYSEHQEMFRRAQIDAILVASPPSTHLDVWSEAAADGLPVFVEKPLALSSQLARLSLRAQPRLMIDFNRRFWPTYEGVVEIVQAGVLGRPVHLEFGLHIDVLRWSRVTRHRLAEDEGGALHDLGSHAIDLALAVIGEEPDVVYASASTRRWTDDRIRVRLTFPSGSSANCDLAYGNRTREWLVVRGTQNTVRVSEPNRRLHLEFRDTPRKPLVAWSLDAAALAYRAFRRSQSFGQASIRSALAAFIHSLRTGSPFFPGFEEGLRTARWIAAAARSAASGGIAQKP